MNSVKPTKKRSVRPLLLALLTAVIGAALTLQFHKRISRAELENAQLSAETLRSNAEQELLLYGSVLESVGALHTLSDAVNQQALDEFIEKGMVHQHDILGTFGLTQRITHPLRMLIETGDHSQPGHYSVTTRNSDHEEIVAPPRPFYYPLTWQSLTDALPIPIGFDFASDPGMIPAIRALETTQRSVVARPQTFDLPADTYWVFAPVLRSSPILPVDTVIGFSVSELHSQRIIDRMQLTDPTHLNLRLTANLTQNTAATPPLHIFKKQWIYHGTIQALGTTWTLQCTLPNPASERRSLFALFFGLIVTALISSQLYILGNRTLKIEALVQSRTQQLNQAKLSLEQNFTDRVQLQEEMNELAARERQRVGQDLHDSLGQKLTGAVFLSRSLLNFIPDDAPNEKDHAKTLNTTLKESVAQVRSMARGLAPVTLNDESLKHTLEQLAEEMTKLYSIPCTFSTSDATLELTKKNKEQLYLIAREAVNNACKHSAATRIDLKLVCAAADWSLSIIDNGTGLPNAATLTPGMGLRIMRYRSDLIGATFSMTQNPTGGTIVECARKRAR